MVVGSVVHVRFSLSKVSSSNLTVWVKKLVGRVGPIRIPPVKNICVRSKSASLVPKKKKIGAEIIPIGQIAKCSCHAYDECT